MQQATTTSWDLRSVFMSAPIHTSVFLLGMLGVFLFLLLVPVIKLLRRTGHHPLWCLLAILPVANLGALWFFAFKPWPTDKQSTTT